MPDLRIHTPFILQPCLRLTPPTSQLNTSLAWAVGIPLTLFKYLLENSHDHPQTLNGLSLGWRLKKPSHPSHPAISIDWGSLLPNHSHSYRVPTFLDFSTQTKLQNVYRRRTNIFDSTFKISDPESREDLSAGTAAINSRNSGDSKYRHYFFLLLMVYSVSITGCV